MHILLKVLLVLGAGGLVTMPIQQAQRDWSSTQTIQQAQKQMDEFEYDLARKILQQAIRIEPKNAEAYLELANLERTMFILRDKDFFRQEAEKHYQRYSELYPASAYVFYQHALMYSEVERYQQALVLLEKAIDLDPNNGGYWLEKGRYLEKMVKLSIARAAYTTSNEVMPNAEAAGALQRLHNQP